MRLLTRSLWLVVLLPLLVPLASFADKSLSMKDLEALSARKSWQEILRRADEVAPSDRNAKYDTIITKAATEYIGGLSEGQESIAAIFLIDGLMKQHDFLKKSREFMDKRAAAGLKAFAECFDNNWDEECVKRFLPFLQADAQNGDLHLKGAKVVRLKQNAAVSVPYFKLALSTNKDKAKVCKDDDLRLSALAGLALPPDYANFGPARDIVFTSCWNELKAPLIKELDGSSGGYLKDNACKVMKEKKLVPADKPNLCKTE